MNKHSQHLIVGIVLFCISAIAVSEELGFPASKTTSPADSVRVIRSVPYTTYAGGRELLADIYLPNEQNEPFPTILMIHGGAWFSGSKVHVTPHARYAAENGYAVVAINYRLAPIYKFPTQLDDCETALRWISLNEANYPFDPDRMAVYGYSAGGHLACLLGLKQNNNGQPGRPIKAIVAGGTPCEFSWIPGEKDTLAYWLGGSRADLPEIYRQASPTSFVDSNDPPVYLFHGKSDRVVPLLSPKKMMAELRKRRVDVTFHVASGGHLATFIDLVARKKAIEFLDRKLELSDRKLNR